MKRIALTAAVAFASLAAFALAAAAQSAPRSPPPGSVPLQDAPPPPVRQRLEHPLLDG